MLSSPKSQRDSCYCFQRNDYKLLLIGYHIFILSKYKTFGEQIG